MQDRHRYHIVVLEDHLRAKIIDLLETSSLSDIKTWDSFPRVVNASLTEEQALWIHSLPEVRTVYRVYGIHLQEISSEEFYEIKLHNVGQMSAFRHELLSRYDVETHVYVAKPQSLFVRLDSQTYASLIENLLSFSTYSSVNDIVRNGEFLREFSRINDSQYSNWGLERITHRSRKRFEQIRLTRTGEGVNIFVLDSGILSQHKELRGRVSAHRYDAFRRIDDPLYGEPSEIVSRDDFGNAVIDNHGTHVASIAAGNTVGVAPNATIIGVRVFAHDQLSNSEHLLDSLDWVIRTHRQLGKPSVVNLSMIMENTASSNITNAKVIGETICDALISSGISVVVSAGNSASDAYDVSPANSGVTRSFDSVEKVIRTTIDDSLKPITVGASMGPQHGFTGFDTPASFSNWGECLDLYAPGYAIYGAGIGISGDRVDYSNTGTYETLSGTSMSAPFVAGIAALHLEANPTWGHYEVRQTIISTASPGRFAENDLRKARNDVLNFETFGETVVKVPVQNPYTFTPNRLAYAWFTRTEITWPEDNFRNEIVEGNSHVYEIRAASTDYYGDIQRLVYNYEPLVLPPVLNTQNFLVNYIESRAAGSDGRTQENEDISAFRVTAPYLSSDTDAIFLIHATDGRVTSTRRFTIAVVNAPAAPVWINPPAGSILSTPLKKGDLIDRNTFEFITSHEDNLPITYTFTPIGSLPPGLQLVNDRNTNRAFIRGRVGTIPYSTESRTYEFQVRATASNGMIAERLFTLECAYQNEPHFFKHVWLTSLYEYGDPNDDIRELQSTSTGNSYYEQIEVTNRDGDELEFIVDYIPNWPETDVDFNGYLPTGLSIDSTGKIFGIVDTSVPAGNYFFRIRVRDQDLFEISQDFVLNVKSVVEDIQADDQILWVTPTGEIGQIYETYPSHLQVEARNPEGKEIKYEVAEIGGGLPDGMELDPKTGMIIGLAPFVDNEMVYSFVIRASIGNRYVDRAFNFKIITLFEGSSVMLVKANMMGPDRLDIIDWTVDGSVLSEDKLYRANDPHFGAVKIPHMYVLKGTYPPAVDAEGYPDNAVYPAIIQQYLRDYHRRMFLIFGNISWAPAYDPQGEYLYDVLYMNVIDPLNKVGGFDENLNEQVLTTERLGPDGETLVDHRYYPTSIRNMRVDLTNTSNDRIAMTFAGNEGFPLWMRGRNTRLTPVDPVYTPAIVIAHVKPGTGRSLVFELVRAGFQEQFSGREFILDRLYIADIVTKVTTLFDVNSSGVATTIFDEKNIADYPLPPDQDPNDFDHVLQQTLFDVRTIESGKYYKFEDDVEIVTDRRDNKYR